MIWILGKSEFWMVKISLVFKCDLQTGSSVWFLNGNILLLNVLNSILEQSSEIQTDIQMIISLIWISDSPDFQI